MEKVLKSSKEGDKLAEAIQYFYGWETEMNNEKTLEIVNQIMAEEEKNKFGEEYLSYCLNLMGLIHFVSTPKRIIESMQVFQKAYEMYDNPDAMYNIAFGYHYGEGELIEKDIVKAMEFYQRAADLNHTDALSSLGFIFQLGEEGVEKNLPKAIEFHEKAAEFNDLNSLCNLARIYEKGIEGIIKKNILKAIELYEKTIQMNHMLSVYNLAIIYFIGDDEGIVEKNILKAIELFERAAEMNDSYALYQLGTIYLNGEKDKRNSIGIDFEVSARYFFKSFQIGDTKAKLEFIDLLHFKKITWKEEYHRFWNAPQDLNHQVLMILLISKFRRLSSNISVPSIFVKGITMKIIMFLCHIRQI